MKVRMGFVSNSSTTSFLLIGTQTTSLVDLLIKAENVDIHHSDFWLEHGILEGSFVEFVGYDNEIEYAGTLISECDLENKTVSQLRLEFVEALKKNLNVDVDIESHYIGLFYGECGSG